MTNAENAIQFPSGDRAGAAGPDTLAGERVSHAGQPMAPQTRWSSPPER